MRVRVRACVRARARARLHARLREFTSVRVCTRVRVRVCAQVHDIYLLFLNAHSIIARPEPQPEVARSR